MNPEHPAILELKKDFLLHDDNTRRKINMWVDRWFSVSMIETVVSKEDMKTVDQDILFDQMFVRMAKTSVSKKTIAVANKMDNGDVHFVMTVHCLNREPNRILRAIS